jgi:hypothetical protein
MERDDQVAVDSLIALLRESFDHVSDVLVIVALVTLDRLDAALSDLQLSGSQLDASQLLLDAAECGRANRCTVDAAASRLEAIRVGDLEAVGADIAQSQFLAPDDELIRGAIALLAIIVAVGARRDGVSPRYAARELCLAASMSDA